MLIGPPSTIEWRWLTSIHAAFICMTSHNQGNSSTWRLHQADRWWRGRPQYTDWLQTQLVHEFIGRRGGYRWDAISHETWPTDQELLTSSICCCSMIAVVKALWLSDWLVYTRILKWLTRFRYPVIKYVRTTLKQYSLTIFDIIVLFYQSIWYKLAIVCHALKLLLLFTSKVLMKGAYFLLLLK